jgi:ligand-binding SRPBCC domain-containing protein
MAIHTLKTVQKIPASLKDTWDFFSKPANLDAITPRNMNFRVLTDQVADKIFPGQIIEYKVSPVFRIPIYWMTEIIAVDKEKYFVDEQRKGPYTLWRHEHYFKETDSGIEMTDLVQYKIPLGFIGEMVNAVFVKKQLSKIFEYRYQKVTEIFGKVAGQTCSVEIR